jgi:hypothetical protein
MSQELVCLAPKPCLGAPGLLEYSRKYHANLLGRCVFTACYAAVVPNHKYAWMVFQLFGQCCFTWVTSLAYVASGLFVPIEELGVSAGLIGTFRSAGGSVGNAVFSTILNSIVNKHLGANIAAAAIANGYSPAGLAALIPAVIENAEGIPFAFAKTNATAAVITATGKAFKDTYAFAFRKVFLSTLPFGIIGLIAAWFVKDPSHLLNNHIAVHQERDVLTGKRFNPNEKQTEGVIAG